MRIAIASSGLGHVARGIETWAANVGGALRAPMGPEQRPGQPPDRRAERASHIEVGLFAGAPLAGGEASTVVLPCLRRSGRVARCLARWSPGFLWRVGLKNPYGWEQLSFWLRLWPHLVRGRFDILHVQDPMIADWCRRFRRLGLVRTKAILAHGTEEPAGFLERFEYVQHLAPWHLEEAEGCRLKAVGGQLSQAEGCRLKAVEGAVAHPPSTAHGQPSTRRLWTAIPNFVDCGVFRTADTAAERKAIRQALGIPEDAFVVGCVAAVKKDHKRIDYLIREAVGCGLKAEVMGEAEGCGLKAEVLGETEGCRLKAEGKGQAGESMPNVQVGSPTSNVERPTSNVQVGSPMSNAQVGNPATFTDRGRPSTVHRPPVFLLLAGAGTEETPELQDMAARLLPGRHRMLLDCPRDRMPDVYRAMDVFVLPSLFEMMPIALLEAMASGLPCLVNRHPVLEWMMGRGEGEGVQGSGFSVQGMGDNSPRETRSTPASTGDGVSAGGLSIDMSREGDLAAALAGLTSDWIAEHGVAARERAERVFSKEIVIGQYVEYYRRVMDDG